MTTENQVSDLDMIRHNMKVYGQETNLERAVPDLSDGLKPVHRRILYAMYKELGSKAVRDGIKSARVIGTTIGLYHPHGDCLEGDTLVPLLNGKTFRIKDLVGCGPKWVLAYDESTNKYVPAKAHSWRVGQKTKTYIQITFSDGSKKRVTKNHPFLKEKDYSWCAAENLKAGDFLVGGSLVPIHNTMRNTTYLYMRSPLGRKPVHTIVADHTHVQSELYNSIDGIVHHKNENTLDNRPSNLALITRADHAQEHKDNYLDGLSIGRKQMFSEGSEFRSATRKKNRALIGLVSQNLGILKALKIVRTMIEAGVQVTEKNYEKFRYTQYNATKLSTIHKKGYTLNDLSNIVNSGVPFLDTSSTKGFTENIHKKRTMQDNLLIRKKETPLTNSILLHNFVHVIKKAIFEYGHSLDSISYRDYIEVKTNLSKVKKDKTAGFAPYKDKLKDKFGTLNIKKLLEKAGPSLNLYVKKVEVIQSSELETFYDFTVDSYHNMVILTGNTKFSTRANTFCVVHNSSCYGAMTTMVNQTLPPILGIGNWGSISSPAGAMRYTNATSNNYFRSFFQPDYLKVVPKIQNYDGSTTEPLVLPALLPNILLNSTSGIGVGIRGEIPSFTPESLLKIMVRRLDGEKLTPVDYVKGLKFSHVYGGVPLKTKENAKNAVELFTNPTGKLLWTVPIKENFANKSITVDRFPPGVDPIKWVEVMRGLEDVKEVTTGAGISRIIRVHPKCNQPQFESILKEVRKSLTKSVSYAIFVTERQAVEDSDSYTTNFHKLTIPQLITKWLKWRIQLEADSLDAQIAQVKEAIHRMGLIIKAALNIDIVSACLKQKNAAETLAKSLSITVEDANFILDKKIRSLSRTDIDKLKAKRLKARDHYLALVERRKSPKTEVRNFLADMSDKFKPYVKWHGTLQTELTTSQFQSVKVDLSEDVSEDSGLPSTDESLD